MNFMTDANLLKKEGSKYLITIPILDIALEHYLEFNGEETLLKVLCTYDSGSHLFRI